MSNIYYAYPIDLVTGWIPPEPKIPPGWAVYLPGSAWNMRRAGMPPSSFERNLDVLRRSDVMVVYLVKGKETRGVWAELALAFEWGVPVVGFIDDDMSGLTAAWARGQMAANWSPHYNVDFWPWVVSQIERLDEHDEQEVEQRQVMRWKTLTEGRTPEYIRRTRDTDAGWDLPAADSMFLDSGRRFEIPTGIAIQPDSNWWGLVLGRSSWQRKGVLFQPAVIDPGYTGELMVCGFNFSGEALSVKQGEYVGQFVPIPGLPTSALRVHTFPEMDRGSKGWGSTDES